MYNIDSNAAVLILKREWCLKKLRGMQSKAESYHAPVYIYIILINCDHNSVSRTAIFYLISNCRQYYKKNIICDTIYIFKCLVDFCKMRGSERKYLLY